MNGTVEGAGVALAYREWGEGQTTLLLHGMADDSTGWEDVGRGLAGKSRAIAYDRRGYGASEAPEPYERTSVQEQAEDAAALLSGLGGAPATIWAVDFGALVALDLLLRHRDLVRSALLIDPVLYALVPEANEALSAERDALEHALREGGPQKAVERWLELNVPDASPERIARARRDAPAFFADLGGLAGWPVSRGDLRGIDRPVRIVDHPGAPPHTRAASAALAELLVR